MTTSLEPEIVPPPVRATSLMERSVAVRAAPAGRGLELCIATESDVDMGGYLQRLICTTAAIDLSRIGAGMPLLLDHKSSDPIGRVDTVTARDHAAYATATLANNPTAQRVTADIAEGTIPYFCSVRYQILDSHMIRTADGPVEVVTLWRLIENTLTTIPADQGAELLALRTAPAQAVTRAALEPDSTLDRSSPALRAESPLSPDVPHKGERSPMADPITAPDNGANALEAELERQDNLRTYGEANGVEASVVLGWTKERTFTLAKAREFVKIDITKKAETETRVRSGGNSPDIIVSSGKGPMDRTGKVKDGEQGGFDNPGEFLRAIVTHARGGETDPRLTRGIAGGQSEALQSDGGALLPAQFEADLSGSKYTPGSILDRVKHATISSNTLNVAVVDETSRVDGSRSGAVSAGWADEADSYTTVGKVKFRTHQFNTKKIVARARVTEEQVEDIPSLSSMLPNEFRKELIFVQENAIVNGTGNGQPQGIITHPALVTQAIEGSQTIANTAASIAANVAKMYSRLVPSLASGAVWLMNVDIFPKLITATLGGTSAAMPIYMPPGGLSASPFGSILGLPVVFTEYNLAEGTVGDILLVNLSEYTLVEKSSGIGMTTSTHTYFDTGETAFRFVKRVDGNATWKSAITPFKGSNTKSFVVGLGTRS